MVFELEGILTPTVFDAVESNSTHVFPEQCIWVCENNLIKLECGPVGRSLGRMK